MVEMIGTFADRTDCWLLAEGLERPEELEVVVDLGVPLGQGYLLGRPAAPWSDLPESVAEMLCRRRVAREQGTVGARVESSAVAPSVEEGRRMLAEDEALEMVVVLDGRSRPLGIVDLDGSVFDAPAPVFRVGVDTPVRQALERAMVRPKATRFSPLVVTDENGKFLGVVHVERLISEILG
jgi:CBS domain-containing protein